MRPGRGLLRSVGVPRLAGQRTGAFYPGRGVPDRVLLEMDLDRHQDGSKRLLVSTLMFDWILQLGRSLLGHTYVKRYSTRSPFRQVIASAILFRAPRDC